MKIVCVYYSGRNVHPGSSKNKMFNSMLIAMELNNLIPVESMGKACQVIVNIARLSCQD